MTGIFGTEMLIQADINLVLQVVTLLIVVIGLVYKNKRKFKIHGKLMGIAIGLHIILFLAVMGPVFFMGFDSFVNYVSLLEVQTTWIHVIPGAIAMILGVFLVVAWVLNPTNVAACSRRKRLMDITTLLWVVSLMFGIATYILFYV